MEIAVLGIDLGKNSCSTVGLDDAGAVVLRRRMRREEVIKLAGKGCPSISVSKKFAYFSSGEVLPPRGLAAQLPPSLPAKLPIISGMQAMREIDRNLL